MTEFKRHIVWLEFRQKNYDLLDFTIFFDFQTRFIQPDDLQEVKNRHCVLYFAEKEKKKLHSNKWSGLHTLTLQEAWSQMCIRQHFFGVHKPNFVPLTEFRSTKKLCSFQKRCHFCWLCVDFTKNDNAFERNEDRVTGFLKWTNFSMQTKTKV